MRKENTQYWTNEFKKAAQVPGGHVDIALQIGYEKELFINTIGAEEFASEMGKIFSVVNDGEYFEEINFKNIAEMIGMDAERAKQVAEVMSITGFLKRTGKRRFKI